MACCYGAARLCAPDGTPVAAIWDDQGNTTYYDFGTSNVYAGDTTALTDCGSGSNSTMIVGVPAADGSVTVTHNSGEAGAVDTVFTIPAPGSGDTSTMSVTANADGSTDVAHNDGATGSVDTTFTIPPSTTAAAAAAAGTDDFGNTYIAGDTLVTLPNGDVLAVNDADTFASVAAAAAAGTDTLGNAFAAGDALITFANGDTLAAEHIVDTDTFSTAAAAAAAGTDSFGNAYAIGDTVITLPNGDTIALTGSVDTNDTSTLGTVTNADGSVTVTHNAGDGGTDTVFTIPADSASTLSVVTNADGSQTVTHNTGEDGATDTVFTIPADTDTQDVSTLTVGTPAADGSFTVTHNGGDGGADTVFTVPGPDTSTLVDGTNEFTHTDGNGTSVTVAQADVDIATPGAITVTDSEGVAGVTSLVDNADGTGSVTVNGETCTFPAQKLVNYCDGTDHAKDDVLEVLDKQSVVDAGQGMYWWHDETGCEPTTPVCTDVMHFSVDPTTGQQWVWSVQSQSWVPVGNPTCGQVIRQEGPSGADVSYQGLTVNTLTPLADTEHCITITNPSCVRPMRLALGFPGHGQINNASDGNILWAEYQFSLNSGASWTRAMHHGNARNSDGAQKLDVSSNTIRTVFSIQPDQSREICARVAYFWQGTTPPTADDVLLNPQIHINAWATYQC